MLLREKDKQTLMQIFSGLNMPVEVWAYGSRIDGSAHEGSDLDLVIRSMQLTPLPIGAFSELYQKIKDSNIPILIELRDWALLPENFQNNVTQHHEVLFDNRKSFS